MGYKAFVASTSKDLVAHRAYVISALRNAGFFVDPMEDWTADAEEAEVFSPARVRGCDLCVLLVAHRRGFVPVGSDLSITQLEYREAVDSRIDVLRFVISDSSLWKPEFDERVRDPATVAWQSELRKHSAAEFDHDPTSLHIDAALSRWLSKRSPEEARIAYLKSLQDTFGYIRFLGMPQIKDHPDVPIQRLFVEPQISPSEIAPDAPSSRIKGETIAQALKDKHRIVLLGDPGTGKSTIVSWITHQLAHSYGLKGQANSWSGALGSILPLPFILRDLNIDRDITWPALLERFIAQHFAKLLQGVERLNELVGRSKAIFLLDGLDEVGDVTARQALKKAIFAGMREFPECRWLMTSRLVGYAAVPFDVEEEEGSSPGMPLPAFKRSWDYLTVVKAEDRRANILRAHVYYVAPFDDDRITQFTANWYLLREADQNRARQDSEEFLRAIAEPKVKALARVPSLLTMMALIHRVRARLPDGRALLYNDISQAYLETIEVYRRIKEVDYTLNEKRSWLARVAFELQRRRGLDPSTGRDHDHLEILADAKDAIQWVRAAMTEVLQEDDRAGAEQFVDYIARRSGLLIPRAPGKLAFTHLSFQEYFAARRLLEVITTPSWLLDQDVPIGTARADLENSSRSDIWAESMVFLVELTAIEHPQWLRVLMETIFGNTFSNLMKGGNEALATLLARLVADPHSGLTQNERIEAAGECAHWEIDAQNARSMMAWADRRVFHFLVQQPGQIREATLARIARQGLQISLRRLDLQATNIDSLDEIARIKTLDSLRLNQTRITAVGALNSLEKLEDLWLEGTTIADLPSLATINSLKHIWLRGATFPEKDLDELRSKSRATIYS